MSYIVLSSALSRLAGTNVLGRAQTHPKKILRGGGGVYQASISLYEHIFTSISFMLPKSRGGRGNSQKFNFLFINLRKNFCWKWEKCEIPLPPPSPARCYMYVPDRIDSAWLKTIDNIHDTNLGFSFYKTISYWILIIQK